MQLTTPFRRPTLPLLALSAEVSIFLWIPWVFRVFRTFAFCHFHQGLRRPSRSQTKAWLRGCPVPSPVPWYPILKIAALSARGEHCAMVESNRAHEIKNALRKLRFYREKVTFYREKLKFCPEEIKVLPWESVFFPEKLKFCREKLISLWEGSFYYRYWVFRIDFTHVKKLVS